MQDDTSLSVAQLLEMSQAELDDLFRSRPAGPMPTGRTDGTAIVLPGTPLAKVVAPITRLLAWQGKVFRPDGKLLKNRVTPLGIRAIAAQVYKAPSWLDGRECTVLDYSRTSLVARKIRDEIREVCPGVYLGVVYWGSKKTINFSLVFS